MINKIKRHRCVPEDVFYIEVCLKYFPMLEAAPTINEKVEELLQITNFLNPPFLSIFGINELRIFFTMIFEEKCKARRDLRINRYMKNLGLQEFTLRMEFVENFIRENLNNKKIKIYLKSFLFPTNVKNIIQDRYNVFNVNRIYSFDSITRGGVTLTTILELSTHILVGGIVNFQEPSASRLILWFRGIFPLKNYNNKVIIHCDSSGANTSRLFQSFFNEKSILLSYSNNSKKHQKHKNQCSEAYNKLILDVLSSLFIKGFEDKLYFELSELYLIEALLDRTIFIINNAIITNRSTLSKLGFTGFTRMQIYKLKHALANFENIIWCKNLETISGQMLIKLNQLIIEKARNWKLNKEIFKISGINLELETYNLNELNDVNSSNIEIATIQTVDKLILTSKQINKYYENFLNNIKNKNIKQLQEMSNQITYYILKNPEKFTVGEKLLFFNNVINTTINENKFNDQTLLIKELKQKLNLKAKKDRIKQKNLENKINQLKIEIQSLEQIKKAAEIIIEEHNKKEQKKIRRQLNKNKKSKPSNGIFRDEFFVIINSYKTIEDIGTKREWLQYVNCRDKVLDGILHLYGFRISNARYITKSILKDIFNQKTISIKRIKNKIRPGDLMDLPFVDNMKPVIKALYNDYIFIMQYVNKYEAYLLNKAAKLKRNKDALLFDSNYKFDPEIDSIFWSPFVLSRTQLTNGKNKHLKYVTELTGTTKRITSHSYRHGLAHSIFATQNDIRIVQLVLHHVSISTTQHYLPKQISMKKLREVYSKAHSVRSELNSTSKSKTKLQRQQFYNILLKDLEEEEEINEEELYGSTYPKPIKQKTTKYNNSVDFWS